MTSTDDTIDGQEPAQTGAPTAVTPATPVAPVTASHFVPTDDTVTNVEPVTAVEPPAKPKAHPLSLIEAEMAGDYETVAQIRMANARRELFEHTDANDDGNILGGQTHFLSGMFYEDQYGMFHSDGTFHDNFGGTYDNYGGYKYADGSYKSDYGTTYDSKTNKVYRADGSERTLPKGITKPEDIATIPEHESQVQHIMDGTKPAKVHKKGAGKAPAGGLTGSGHGVTPTAEQVTNVVMETRHKKHKSQKPPITPAEVKAAEAKIAATQAQHSTLETQFKTRLASNNPKSGLTTATQAEVTAAVGKLHNAQASHAQATASTAAPAGASTPTGATADPASDVTFYKDATNNGYWDSLGGYYDDKGGYWDASGGYTDKNGGYTDTKGNYTWPDGTFMDAKGNYVDTSGALWTAGGQKFDKQEGVDYIAKLKDAEANNTTYLPASKGTSINIEADDDDGALTAVTNSTVASRHAGHPEASPDAPPPVVDISGMGSTSMPDLSHFGTTPTVVPAPVSSSAANADGSKYTATLDLGGTTGVAKGMLDSSLACPAAPLADDDFSSIFDGFKTSIVDNKSVVETKFFDSGTACTTSPLMPSSSSLLTTGSLSSTGSLSLTPTGSSSLSLTGSTSTFTTGSSLTSSLALSSTPVTAPITTAATKPAVTAKAGM